VARKKKKTDELTEAITTEETLPETETEIGAETEATPPETEETETAGLSKVTISVTDIPELAGKDIGDTITFVISDISDDGKTFELQFAESPETETGEESKGRATLTEALIGTEE